MGESNGIWMKNEDVSLTEVAVEFTLGRLLFDLQKKQTMKIVGEAKLGEKKRMLKIQTPV